MKIRINYDILHEVELANNGCSLKKDLYYNLRFAWVPGIIAGAVIYSKTKNPMDIIGSNLRCPIIFMCFNTLWTKLISGIPEIKEMKEFNAYNNLKKLATDLSILQVKTNATLLKDTLPVKREYRITTNDKHLPVVVQNKYINIPILYGNGEIGSEVLLQEHVIGSRKYDVSVKSPNKELKLQKVYGNA